VKAFGISCEKAWESLEPLAIVGPPRNGLDARAKRENLSGNLIVQLGTTAEPLNRLSTNAKRDGPSAASAGEPLVAATWTASFGEIDAVFEAKFVLPWAFSEDAAAEKQMA
jgi:hypothetical protein